jgi:thiamine transport system substrate-binding protein
MSRLFAALTTLLLLAGAAFAQERPAPGEQVLRILAHDYFSIDEDVAASFERDHGARIEIIAAGDANLVLERAIARAGDPEADLLFGVDNLVYRRAIAADAFAPYEAARRAKIPADIRAQFADSPYVTPIDYGYVTLNWDKAAPGRPPASYEELTGPAWRGKLVVQNPETSSPGLQFLLSTVAAFGSEGAYDWRDFWQDLRDNDVLVAADWGEAYTEHFSARGGDRPLVVSYTTSPAAEVDFSEGRLSEPPTENVILGPLFRQVEVAAVLRGAAKPELAEAFIDFMLTDAFQAQIPASDHVYPVIPGLPMPEWWRWAEIDVEPAQLEVEQVTIDGWVVEWKALFE